MTRLLLATRNRGKLRELETLIDDPEIQLECLETHPEVTEVEETAKTFEGNAELKAVHAARASGLWSLGEDSGLEVDALAGAPGVRSARYSGTHGDDALNNAKLLRELEGVSERGARYVCVMALADPGGAIVETVRGTFEGRITETPRGRGGFGYDPLFEPAGETRTAAELSPAEKHAMSHRGAAARTLLPQLRAHLAAGTNDR